MISIEALYFGWVAKQPSDSNQSSYAAIVVFSGSLNRLQRAYNLAKQGVAPVLIISPANKHDIEVYERHYGVPGKAKYVLEEKAETTFTNALYSAQLIRENHLSPVLLVTSDYHMPRSFFLLKLLMLTTDCRIAMSKLDTGAGQPASWLGQPAMLKMTYNEMVQLWGSLLEGGLHYLGGPNAWLRKRSSGVARWLREHLLFDVPCLDCG
jgi:uncharacterized SAM-binding protein YcdF (DUF218 family)